MLGKTEDAELLRGVGDSIFKREPDYSLRYEDSGGRVISFYQTYIHPFNVYLGSEDTIQSNSAPYLVDKTSMPSGLSMRPGDSVLIELSEVADDDGDPFSIEFFVDSKSVNSCEIIDYCIFEQVSKLSFGVTISPNYFWHMEQQ